MTEQPTAIRSDSNPLSHSARCLRTIRITEPCEFGDPGDRIRPEPYDVAALLVETRGVAVYEEEAGGKARPYPGCTADREKHGVPTRRGKYRSPRESRKASVGTRSPRPSGCGHTSLWPSGRIAPPLSPSPHARHPPAQPRPGGPGLRRPRRKTRPWPPWRRRTRRTSPASSAPRPARSGGSATATSPSPLTPNTTAAPPNQRRVMRLRQFPVVAVTRVATAAPALQVANGGAAAQRATVATTASGPDASDRLLRRRLDRHPALLHLPDARLARGGRRGPRDRLVRPDPLRLLRPLRQLALGRPEGHARAR